MHDRPPGVGDHAVREALAEGWGIAVTSVDYAAVGFGSYHWSASGTDGQRFFVTVDDLPAKPWLGATSDAAYSALRTRFDVAGTLRERARLRFVVAPIPTAGGAPAHRLDEDHSIALFPFVDGQSGDFGDDLGPEQRADVVRMLAELHLATPLAPTTQPLDLDFAGRAGLEAARQDVNSTWQGGPYAEPTRGWLAVHADDLDRLLGGFDELVAEVVATDAAPVITHGEPHPGNVMRTETGLQLIDWDTVGLAPPERDLWHVATASDPVLALYTELTGHVVSGSALSLYRLAWDLADTAVYVKQFRSPHEDTQDTEQAWRSLTSGSKFELATNGR